mgnify:CR=1 FL=1
MKNKKNVISKNYLEKKPIRKNGLNWTKDEKGIVTLEIENKGVFNRLAQKLLKKPKISYIHLDETGSFIWPLIDGEKDIIALGELVEEHFGEKAHPLYERLSQYFKILENYGFITFK